MKKKIQIFVLNMEKISKNVVKDMESYIGYTNKKIN